MILNNKDSRLELPQIFEVTLMIEAINLAFELTPKGKVCLMSPGAPSYNLFKNYADRGDQFKAEIKKRK